MLGICKGSWAVYTGFEYAQLCINQILQNYSNSLGEELLVGRTLTQGLTRRAITRWANSNLGNHYF